MSVEFINASPFNKDLSDYIPEVGKMYYHYDDGKIRPNREYKVTVEEVIPFNEIDKDTLDTWRKERDQCYWLFREDTDYFVIGEVDGLPEDDKRQVYVRTKHNNGWFSMDDWWGGRLDVDGSLRQYVIENYGE